MPIRIKTIDSLKKKYIANTATAGGSYEEGVRNPRRSQSQQAVAAKATFAAAVQEAIDDDRYAKGVQEAGDAKWSKGALEKGKGRYASGAAQGADEWATNTKPIIDAISAVDLPPRGVKGSEENFNRARMVAQAAMDAAKR